MSALSAVLREPRTGLVLDLSQAPALDPALTGPLERALAAMQALEAGAIANPDEGRMVGHYWLRAPELAPSDALGQAIRAVWSRLPTLADPAQDQVLLIGIGGSALGPMLVDEALRGPGDRARLLVLDNTDPEGLHRLLAGIQPGRCRVVVASKSGGTVETANGLLAARARWERAGVPFAPAAVAVTGEGSALDRMALAEGWSARIPMWDWVGGRTSVTGPVGLVPMALLGQDWEGLLRGAAAMDEAGRAPLEHNPAARLAAAWWQAGQGRGERALVLLPYRDRLHLLARYLQQLVMESLGKAQDRQGRTVHQGLTVYGNKGSTDQHAFVQQVRDGRDDVFVHFVETLDPQAPPCPGVDGFDAADHLLGFLYGTREALRQAGRPSLVLQLPRVDAPSLGALIALFERAVGIYAELADLNAYHQPGVEAGKKAASQTLRQLRDLAAALQAAPRSAEQLAALVGVEPLTAWRLAHHLAARGLAVATTGTQPTDDRFSLPPALES